MGTLLNGFQIIFGIFLILFVSFGEISSETSKLYNSDNAGFADGWYIIERNFTHKKFIVNINKTEKLVVLRPTNKQIFHFIMSPVIKVEPAWRITVKATILVDDEPFPQSSIHLVYNGVLVSTLPKNQRFAKASSRIKSDIEEQIDVPVKKYNRVFPFMTFGLLEKNAYCNNYSEREKMIKKNLKKKQTLGIILDWSTYAQYPNGGQNITLTNFMITYINCPKVVHKLVSYPNQAASNEPQREVYADGVCVRNAIQKESFPAFRKCNYLGKESYRGSCMCDKAYETDKTGTACKKCEEGFFKTMAADRPCIKCGRNSAARLDRLECTCLSETYRFANETKDWSKDCYFYPSRVRSFQVVKTTSTRISLGWLNPKRLGTLPPIFRIECASPVEACELQQSTKGFVETSNLTFTYTDLLPNINYEFTIHAYNSMFISYGGQSRPNLIHYRGDLKTLTKEGYPTGVRNLIAKRESSHENIISVDWDRPISTGSPNFVYLLRYDGKNETITNTEFSFKLEKTDRESIDIEVFVLSTMPSSRQLLGAAVNETVELLVKPPEDLLPTILGAIIGTMAGILLLLIIFMAFTRFRRYVRTNDDELMNTEAKQRRIAFELELTKLHISKDNLYVPLDVLLDQSGDTYASEPIYTEIPTAGGLYDYNKLTEKETLGQWEFGLILKAKAKNICGNYGDSWVTVKQLKANCKEPYREYFKDELDLLLDLKHHENVVKLLGHCKNPDCIILEFLPGGDLLTFLTKSRDYCRSTNNKGFYFTSAQLLKFSEHICKGMRHIASNNIVHCDLAARNVLVGYGNTCKISFSGLARRLNNDGNYHRTHQAKLPVKWMPLESIKYGLSTIKSDVWSFGIVLYEIFTIGGVPYPHHKSKDIPKYLEEGNRMNMPPTCNAEIYSLMLDCWENKERDRPDFQQLVTRVNILQDNMTEDYLDLNVEKEAYISLSGGDYLKNDDFFVEISTYETNGRDNFAYDKF